MMKRLRRAWDKIVEMFKPISSPPNFNLPSKNRILFVANGLIPTLQLSFLKPLQEVPANELEIRILTETEILAVPWFFRARFIKRIFSQQFEPTLIVFCRYSGPEHRTLLNAAKRAGIKCLYHIDDNLLNIPREIGETKFKFHNRPERIESVTSLLKNVDLVYCSTDRLAAELQTYVKFRDLHVGNIYCSGKVLNSKARHTKTIGYMGFDHAHDLEQILPAIEQVLDEDPETHFQIFGPIPMPEKLKRFGNRVSTIQAVRDYDQFLSKLAGLEWAIGICPLAINKFNLLKANTKWVEYTMAGICSVGTAGTVYDSCMAENRGILLDNDSATWKQNLQTLLSNYDLRESIVHNAQAHLSANYSQEILRRQVKQVFSRLYWDA